MGRYRDVSGIENTCPKIDEVISAIESVNWDEHNYWDAITLTKIMEKIREANSELRDWGNEMSRERDDLQDEVYRLEKEIEKLNDDLNYYTKQLTENYDK